MSNKRTIKALEELVKTEHMAVGALDSALEEVEDNKMRRAVSQMARLCT